MIPVEQTGWGAAPFFFGDHVATAASMEQVAAREGRFEKRRAHLVAMFNELKHQNETLRSPCPTCGTLVRPELQGQHDNAYHPRKFHS